MNKIIVATDFSEVAKNAAEFAVHFSKTYNRQVHLVHSYSIALPPTDNPIPFLPNLTAVENIQEENMAREIHRLKELFPDSEITYSLFIGDTFDALNEEIAKGNVVLSIMGTTGENKSNSFWGSQSMKALRELNGPVMIVPPGVKYHPIKNILLTADLENMDKKFPYENIKKWINDIHGNLDILNIQPLDAFQDEDTKTGIEFFKGIPHTFHNVEDNKIGDGVKYYLDNNNVDLIIVVPKKYNFFEKLFHNSKSELIAQKSDVPVLAIHYND